MTRLFIWLSGAGEESLRDCPSWERRKYVAFGATVLVPCVFALMASSYAIHTLTTNRFVICGAAMAWSFIILTIDRALLATYRAYQSNLRKLGQFSLRVTVATLMGLTISHPLTLLLFRDTITSVIEKDRGTEMEAVQATASGQKKILEDKVAGLNGEIADMQKQWGETFTAGFRAGEQGGAAAELEKSIADAQTPTRGKIEETDKEIAALTEQSTKLQGELDFWQKEFERELNGQRSGLIGLGPRAKSIQSDQLEWRRSESKRLADLLRVKTKERNQRQAEAAETEQQMKDRQREEQRRLDDLNRQMQFKQTDQFVDHQNQIRATLKLQIDQVLEQMRQAQIDLAKLGDNAQARIASIQTEPRRDLLRQTLALRHLFHEGDQGGKFALTTYLVLSLLFMLVDTIPLVLKFFSKPGPYDTLVDCDEVRFDRKREAFLKGHHSHPDNLSAFKGQRRRTEPFLADANPPRAG